MRLKRFAKKVLPESMVKKIRRYRQRRSARYSPISSYTIVSPTYNVSRYLDEFLQSIVNQTIDSRALEVIMVDDGSTDDSAAIIEKWRSRYPRLITYVRKENGGLPSARNFGMAKASNQWVTFADPDDFLAPDYFEQVDRAVREHPDAMLMAAKEVMYYEAEGEVKDTHPLRGRFKKGNVFYRFDDEDHLPIIMAAGRSFYRVDEIRQQGIKADEQLFPSFEDGHFTNKYLLNLRKGSVGFLREPIYYYRKRAGADSLLDGTWSTEGKLLVQPRRGYLDLLKYAQHVRGYVPANIQRTVMYDLAWYFRHFVGHPAKSQFLAEDQIDEAYDLFHEICSYLDEDVLFAQPAHIVGFDQKIAFCRGFMGKYPLEQRVILQRVDVEKKTLHFRTFGNDQSFLLDGIPTKETNSKRTGRTFLGRNLYDSFEFYYSYQDLGQTVDFAWPHEVPTTIRLSGRVFHCPVTVGELIEEFTKNWGEYRNDDAWVIMDRDTQADDNGEHFYRYMMRSHPEQECYFALRRTSRDWQRLEDEGFRLVDFGSPECDELFRRASKIISSHAEKYNMSYFGDHYHYSKKFIFLQHGVIRSDLSSWLNSKRAMDIMLTSTVDETKSIIEDGSPYVLTSNEIALTGLPRHDALLKKQRERRRAQPTILIMPTWRNWIVGPLEGRGNQRMLSPAFLESGFKSRWEAFLEGSFVEALAEKGVRIVFFPHANILPYVEAGWFTMPDWVELGSANGSRSIQDYFVDASVFVTDYSSTIFEAAYLEKPCVYYQFDKEEFFSGKHSSALGYFDDEKQGFGPVAYGQPELEEAIGEIIENGYEADAMYRTRMRDAFLYRDGRCGDRVYEEITRRTGKR